MIHPSDRLISPEDEARLLAEAGIAIDWGEQDVLAADAAYVLGARSHKGDESSSERTPMTIAAVPEGPPKAVVCGWDPARSATRKGDDFGRSVVYAYDSGVALVVDAGVMPRVDADRKPLDQRALAGLALEVHDALAGLHPGVAIFHTVDGRGSGLAFLEALRELGGTPMARKSIVDFQTSANLNTPRRWPPRREAKTGYLTWTLQVAWYIEGTNAALQSGRLMVAPNLADLAKLLDERSRYQAKELPSGRFKFGAPGSAHDDRLSAVLSAACAARHCVPRSHRLARAAGYELSIGG